MFGGNLEVLYLEITLGHLKSKNWQIYCDQKLGALLLIISKPSSSNGYFVSLQSTFCLTHIKRVMATTASIFIVGHIESPLTQMMRRVKKYKSSLLVIWVKGDSIWPTVKKEAVVAITRLICVKQKVDCKLTKYTLLLLGLLIINNVS